MEHSIKILSRIDAISVRSRRVKTPGHTSTMTKTARLGWRLTVLHY